jgi:hypothetical protein
MKEFKFLKIEPINTPINDVRHDPSDLWRNTPSINYEPLNDTDVVQHMEGFILRVYGFGIGITLIVKYLVDAGF